MYPLLRRTCYQLSIASPRRPSPFTARLSPTTPAPEGYLEKLEMQTFYFIWMRVQEICSEVQEGIRRKNSKKVDSLFNTHLKHSHSKELWTLYLHYVQHTAASKEVVKEAVQFAFKKTYYNLHSTDIKIRYLELLMQTEEKAQVVVAYSKMLEVPLVRAGTLIEFYRDYELSRSKTYKKAPNELLPKEVRSQEESLRLEGALRKCDSSEQSVGEVVEYVLKKYREKHPMFGSDLAMYTLDAALEVLPESAQLHLYKAMLLMSEPAFAAPEQIVNGLTRNIVQAKGKSEKMIKCSEYLLDALKKTNNSLPVLLALTSYQFVPESILALAPPGITAKSEAFYTIFFTALLKHKDLATVRYYLVKLSTEEKIGHAVYCFGAMIEGVIGKERKCAGGVLLTGLKLFLGKAEKGSTSKPFISPKENAYQLAINGARILLSLGDIQQAKILVDLFEKHAGGAGFAAAPKASEQHPRLVVAAHQILFELGFLGVSPLLSDFSFREIYEFLCRIYNLETTAATAPVRVSDTVTQFIAALPAVRDSQHLCSEVNLDDVIRLVQHIEIG